MIVTTVYTILLVLLTIAATISLLAGFVIVTYIRRWYYDWLFNTYLWALIAMAITLVATTAWGWGHLTLTSQIIHVALSVVSLYAVYRGFVARHKHLYRYTGWRLDLIDDVGFTLVFLLTGFLVLVAVNLHLPIWAIIPLCIIGIVSGWQWLLYIKRRYLMERAKKEGF